MIKNKKAAIFLTFVSFSLIIAYIFFITTFSSNAESQPKDFTKQPEILETYQQGEKILLYIDLSAKYSAYKTIHNLAKNGGSFDDLGCGKSSNFILWNSQDKECFPVKKSLYRTFSKDFNLNLDEYLKKYEEPRLLLDKIMVQNQKQEIPLDNYDLLFKDKQMIGIATQNLAINKENINYSIKPSFKINLDYDLFDDYDYLVEKAKEIIDGCSQASETIKGDTEVIKIEHKERSMSITHKSGYECTSEEKTYELSGNNLEPYEITNVEDNKDGSINIKMKHECKISDDSDTVQVYIYSCNVPIYEEGETLKNLIIYVNGEIEYNDGGEIPSYEEESTSKCVGNLIDSINLKEELFKWEFSENEKNTNTFMFNVKSNKIIPFYSSESRKVLEQPIIYKFALYLGQSSEVNQ